MMKGNEKEEHFHKKKTVKVIVRVRPFLKNETSMKCVFIEGKYIHLKNAKIKTNEVYKYKFDNCYDEKTPQDIIYKKEVEPLLNNLFEGLNVTIFAYGVTGAGKTHTMQGTEEEPGIIPHSLQKLIQISKFKNSTNNPIITISYVEIYNEKVYDLLEPKEYDLPIREDQCRNIIISNLSEKEIKSYEEFQNIYYQGCKNRTVGATKLNAKSSRSHAILMVKVTLKEKEIPFRTLIGKLNLIDLAGSEDNRRTDSKGVRLIESCNINQSLFVLGKVVDAINKGYLRIPYRDSKLTRLLQDSLGGNSYSVIITNIAPGQLFYHDTQNSLNFASKSRLIVNNPTVNFEQEKNINVQEVQLNKKIPSLFNKRKSNEEINEKKKIYKALDNNKENENLENKIEKLVQNKIEAASKKLISPWIKKQKLLDNNTTSRLERLERKLIEQTQEEFQEISKNIIEEQEELPIKVIDKLEAFTPFTKVKNAKQCVINAKLFEKKGDLHQALYQYQKAYNLMDYDSQNESVKKILKKIQQLQESISKEQNNLSINNNTLEVSSLSSLSSLSSNSVNNSSNSINDESFILNSKEKYDSQINIKNDIFPKLLNLEEKSNSIKNESNILKKSEEYKNVNEEDDDDEENYEPKKKKKNKKSSLSNEENIDAQILLKVEKKLLEILNYGNIKALKELNGIGLKKAQSIIDYRTNKTFTKLIDLYEINGFGKQFTKTLLYKNIDIINNNT